MTILTPPGNFIARNSLVPQHQRELSNMALRIPFDEGFWYDYLSGQSNQLPMLGDVDEVSGRVVRVNAGNPGHMQLQGTNTYIVGTGPKRILIDTGEGAPVWISRIVKLLKEKHVELEYILITHWHGDHTGGVPDLIAYDNTMATKVYKHMPDYFQQEISDGQTFRVEGATVRALYTPGHAVDHMCFRLEEENALFTGDNVLGHGFSVVQDLTTYLRSLQRMEAEGCAIGYPGHGARIEALPAKMKEYIRHKEVRVNQVYTVLVRTKSEVDRIGQAGRGGLTLQEIIKSIYGDVSADLAEKALAPLLTQVL